MTNSIPSQRKQLYKLFGYDKETEAMHVLNVTEGKHKTAKELSVTEANALIKKLTTNWAVFDVKNQKHKYILSLLIQIGWSKPHEKYGEIADMQRLSNFLKSKKSPISKPLQDMYPEELSKLIFVLEKIVETKYK
ncbi:MAG TPA: hypothetical protein VKZ97_10915 [Flavobacteriaceae bacterium]|nr:hypothetical protein [Flavobacteriaceae bacterium]